MYYHCVDLQQVSASQVHNTGAAKHNLLYNVKKINCHTAQQKSR